MRLRCVHWISVIPLRCDGSKAPALKANEPQIYSRRLPHDDELLQWFGNPRTIRGLGLKCGVVSGGLEALDLDFAALLHPLLSMLSRQLIGKLTVVETPGGAHLLYRCNEICGSRKIASWESLQSLSQMTNGHRDGSNFQSVGKGVRIESRGEGGYIVAVASPCETHASGKSYVQILGPPLPALQIISPEERREMWLLNCSISGLY